MWHQLMFSAYKTTKEKGERRTMGIQRLAKGERELYFLSSMLNLTHTEPFTDISRSHIGNFSPNYNTKRFSVTIQTYNFQICICRVTVHHCLSCARVAPFMPDLDILYSQVTAAIIALGHQRQVKTLRSLFRKGELEEERGRETVKDHPTQRRS